MDIVFVTYEAHPEPSPNDSLVAQWLIDRGHKVRGVPWTSSVEQMARCDLAVVRSTWDYPQHPERFAQWLDDIRGRVPIANPVDLMAWNMNKRYLFELEQMGFRIPRTAVLEEASDVDRIMAAWSVDAAVVKPLIGASGTGVHKVRRGEALDPFEPSQCFVQEFVEDIADGELSLAFFGGEFSHAVIKIPSPGEFRINSAFGGEIREMDPDPCALDRAVEILEALPSVPLYARVDGLVIGGEFVVFELELVEPSFFFSSAPEGAGRFGEAILQQAQRTR